MSQKFTLPPEWAEQSAIQLTWPHKGTDWAEYLDDINATYIEMAKAISSRQKLLVVTPYKQAVENLLQNCLDERQMNNIILHECPTNDTWARDHGFITLTNNNGEARLLDFRFNGWGDKFEAELDNGINRGLYNSGICKGDYIDHNNFVLEGGSIESDGKGTVFTTSCCLMAPHRNQPLSREDINSRLITMLHAERVLWIDHGSLEGDDTDGHIDTLVRTAPNDTLVYVGCEDSADSHYESFKAMEKQLESFRTLDGRPYRLLKLPMPQAMYDDGERLPATYANFIILNGAVILPVYNQPENDSKAEEIMREAFPGYDIICIDSSTVVRQHGSLHCCTMQYPKGVI